MEQKENQQRKTRELNILLVDDSEADIKIAQRAFGQAKIKNRLFVVQSAQECFDFIFHDGSYRDCGKYLSPDLILLDISMPQIDGFAVLKNLKQEDATKDIPVIILTGSKNQEDIGKSYHMQAASFIQKPVTYERFVEFIDVFNVYWNIVCKLPQASK